MLQFLLENWQSIFGYLVGGSGLGLLFFRQDKQAKIITNISSATDEWKKFVEEVKRENSELKNEKQELKNKNEELYSKLYDSLENDANAAYYKGLYHASRCDVWTCPNRRPPIKETEQQINE